MASIFPLTYVFPALTVVQAKVKAVNKSLNISSSKNSYCEVFTKTNHWVHSQRSGVCFPISLAGKVSTSSVRAQNENKVKLHQLRIESVELEALRGQMVGTVNSNTFSFFIGHRRPLDSEISLRQGKAIGLY